MTCVMRGGVPASGSFLSFLSRKSNNARNAAIFSDLSRPSHRKRFPWNAHTSPSTEKALLPPPWRSEPESLKNFQNVHLQSATAVELTVCVSKTLLRDGAQKMGHSKNCLPLNWSVQGGEVVGGEQERSQNNGTMVQSACSHWQAVNTQCTTHVASVSGSGELLF